MAREWLDKQIRGVCTPRYARNVLSRLERLIFPVLGGRDIREITAPDLLRVFRDIEDQDKVYSAHQVSSYCSRIFRYAVATGRAERDPTADLQGFEFAFGSDSTGLLAALGINTFFDGSNARKIGRAHV